MLASKLIHKRLPSMSRRRFSSMLEGDTGEFGTRIHHATTTVLAVFTPLYMLIPDVYTDGVMSKTFGALLSLNISVHSWIGLNYVCRDYVPKISVKLLGPARIATAGLSMITLLGMTKISIISPGGLKGAVKGLWSASPADKKGLHDFQK